MSMPQEPIKGLTLLETKTFSDYRGRFRETFHHQRLEQELGRPLRFVQDNESLSIQVGVLRGLHFQKKPCVQAKLVRVTAGAIFDVGVDLRPQSPTYGQWRGYELSAENGRGLFVPEGFAHGFCTLAPNTVVTYKVTAYYAPECDAGLKWDDPDLAVDWPLPPGGPVLSEKDAALPTLAQLGKLEW